MRNFLNLIFFIFLFICSAFASQPDIKGTIIQATTKIITPLVDTENVNTQCLTVHGMCMNRFSTANELSSEEGKDIYLDSTNGNVVVKDRFNPYIDLTTDLGSYEKQFRKGFVGQLHTNYTSKNDNYIVLDTDGISYIEFTNLPANKTVTLPTPGDNIGREITIERNDSLYWIKILLDNASDTIDGISNNAASNSFYMNNYDKVKFKAVAANKWKILEFYSLEDRFSNWIINGGFTISQRGLYTSSTTLSDTSETYYLDGWFSKYVTGTNNNFIQSTTIPSWLNSSKSVQLQVPGNPNSGLFAQHVYNYTALKNKVVSLSASLKSTNNCSMTLNDDVSLTTYTNLANNNWGVYTINKLISNNANFVEVYFNIANNSTIGTTCDFTGVKLNIGMVPTAFKEKSIYEELKECQSFYQKSFKVGTVPGTIETKGIDCNTGINGSASNSYLLCPVRFSQTMICAPTITLYATTTGTVNKVTLFNVSAGSVNDNTSGSAIDVSDSGFNLGTQIGTGYSGSSANYTAECKTP